jgi:hypothetical protein
MLLAAELGDTVGSWARRKLGFELGKIDNASQFMTQSLLFSKPKERNFSTISVHGVHGHSSTAEQTRLSTSPQVASSPGTADAMQVSHADANSLSISISKQN